MIKRKDITMQNYKDLVEPVAPGLARLKSDHEVFIALDQDHGKTFRVYGYDGNDVRRFNIRFRSPARAVAFAMTVADQ